MAATKLSLINGAQRLLKVRKLTAAELASNLREPARIANDAFDADLIRGCLEAGAWRFAIRSQQIFADPGIDPQFDTGGLQFAFQKPTDWVRTVGMFSDADMQCQYEMYNDEAGFLFADLDTLYWRYISDDADFGSNYTLWPRSFQEYFEAKLASVIAGPMTQSGQEMMQLSEIMLGKALSKDVLNEPTRQQPLSSWARSRLSGGWSRDQRREGS